MAKKVDPRAGVSRLCKDLDVQVGREDWQESLELARKLWKIVRDAELSDAPLRVTCAASLVMVADLFQHVSRDSYEASLALRRAYDFGVGEVPATDSIPTLRENVAHRIGLLYEAGKCHRSAVFWFERALALAKTRPVLDHVLLNLYHVAWNLEPISLADEPGPYYDEIVASVWPTSDRRVLARQLANLMPAATYKLSHGEEQLGLRLFEAFKGLFDDPGSKFETWFAAGLYGLALFHISKGSSSEAIEIGELLLRSLGRFPDSDGELPSLAHGIIARARLLEGDMDATLAEIGEVFDLKKPLSEQGGSTLWLENLELGIDVARIRAARADYVGAASAYSDVALGMGAKAADYRIAKTARARSAWIEEQAVVVHELVSVWLQIKDSPEAKEIESVVANAMLQLKANMHVAGAANRLTVFRNWVGLDKTLFLANRRLAAAASGLGREEGDIDAILRFEDMLFAREQLESRMVAGPMEMNPYMAGVFHYDFRQLKALQSGGTLIDYTLVDYSPPREGRASPTQGKRYVGVCLSKGALKIVDLGPSEVVDEQCLELVREFSRRPAAATPPAPEDESTADDRHLGPAANSTFGDRRDVHSIGRRVYASILAPFEPLGDSLIVAPDGVLSAIPFHALSHVGARYLVEDCDVRYCHSLLREQAIVDRQMRPGMQISAAVADSHGAVLMGDPEYGPVEDRLIGTRTEVEKIGKLLVERGWDQDEVRLALGKDATPSVLTEYEHPRVLHLAAHGAYANASGLPQASKEPGDRFTWRRKEDMGSASLCKLDSALLNASLSLSAETSPSSKGPTSPQLTALELSSLNLIAARLVVLSACDTGIGSSERGTGVLGFQYALSSAFASTSLVSLWRVPDRETADLMVDLYERILSNDWRVGEAYDAALRAACRKDGDSVHPYYWAAFIYLGAR